LQDFLKDEIAFNEQEEFLTVSELYSKQQFQVQIELTEKQNLPRPNVIVYKFFLQLCNRKNVY